MNSPMNECNNRVYTVFVLSSYWLYLKIPCGIFPVSFVLLRLAHRTACQPIQDATQAHQISSPHLLSNVDITWGDRGIY